MTPPIDFSYTDRPKTPLKDHPDWEWQFNIPCGGSNGWTQNLGQWKEKVFALQCQHGCLNVTSGSPQRSKTPGLHLGLYIRRNDGRHRDKLCTCVIQRRDVAHWPPRY